MSGGQAERAPLRSGFLAAGAHRVWWELHGSGERETVCLLNGLAMHTKAWYPFLDDLPGFDVLLYDYLGQGASSSPDEAIPIPRLAAHLAAILDELDLPGIHLLGVSYGGFVALDFARLHEKRLSTLTLSGVLLSRQRSFELYQAMSLRFYAGGPELFALYTHYLYEKIFGEAFLRATAAEQLEAMRRRFEERYTGRIHSLVRLTEAQDPFFAALDTGHAGYQAIRTPTLILAGEEDRAIPPWMQRQLTTVLPEAVFELVPDSGHVVYLERRELFFSRLRRFLTTRDPRA